tara:strand:+ start:124 stop:1200 length:1077 start_codon:yes stop_codon:yes gene_type:complete
MAKLKTYKEFVNEAIIDAIKSPIKYTKIKNNMKKYQKGLVTQALNDVDYAKKKEVGKGELTPDQKAKLKLAKDAKNTAIDKTVDLTIDRMNDLATTPGLQKVVSLGKTKSKIAANKVVLKSATGEIAKTLKVKEKELEAKAAKTKTALKDYEATDDQVAKAKKDTPPPVKSDKDNEGGTSTDSGETTAEIKKKQDAAKQKMKDQTDGAKSKMDKDVADNKAKMDKGKKDDEGGIGRLDYVSPTEDDPEEINYEVDIKAFNKNIEEERTQLVKKEKELTQAKRDQKLGRVSDEEIQKIEKGIEDSKEDIAELKKKEADAKKALAKQAEDERKAKAAKKESFTPLVESVSEKFARLRPNL